MAFAKLKSHLRKAAARTLSDLQRAVAASLAQFAPAHCRGFFRHARYGTINRKCSRVMIHSPLSAVVQLPLTYLAPCSVAS